MELDIVKIKFSKESEDELFNLLTSKFDINDSDLYSRGGKTIDLELTDLIDIQATLELYSEGYVEEDTNASIISERCVIKFKYFFTNKEGDEVQAEMINTCGDCIDDRISDYYRI